jgi:metal-sulfur cluster biosynthetic enzyme
MSDSTEAQAPGGFETNTEAPSIENGSTHTSECGSASATAAVHVCEETVREQLKKVIDPELFVNIVDLGLVYVVNVFRREAEPDKLDVKVEMTLTSPMCPAGPQLVANSRQVIEAMPGVASADI